MDRSNEVTKGILVDFEKSHEILVEKNAHDPSRLVICVRRKLPEKIEPWYFEERVGREPENDDIDRCNCEDAGKPGHHACGWCPTCDQPRFICGHMKWGDDR